MPKEGRWVEIYLGGPRADDFSLGRLIVGAATLGLTELLPPNSFESEWENTETGDTITGYGETEEEAQQDALNKIR